ncbi:MAG: ABC transporter permease [Parvibaculaceae bacterium]
MKAVFAAARQELARIFTLKPVFSVMILATAIYALFYPQPYLNEALRDVPVAVVDRDGTTSSRELARRIEATSDVAVAMILPDLPSAERAVHAREVSGILLIPKDFERDLLHGRSSPIALYADASYFLNYQRVSGAVTAVARAFGAEVEAARLIALGIDPALATAAGDPMPLTAVPLFNPQGGYATYVLPAAFVLLLQQTLLMGAGLLGTFSRAGGPLYVGDRLASTAGRLLAYLALQAVILPVYLIGLPYLYGVPRLGPALPILIFAVPFVLAVGSLGLFMASVFRNPLIVQLVCGAIGLPFFFLAGFAWPAEAIPEPIRLLALLVPSTSAIDGFVRLSQLGATLSDVQSQFFVLWGLAFAYAGAAALNVPGTKNAASR